MNKTKSEICNKSPYLSATGEPNMHSSAENENLFETTHSTFPVQGGVVKEPLYWK